MKKRIVRRTPEADADLKAAGVPDSVIKKAEWTIERGPGFSSMNVGELLQTPTVEKDGWKITPFVNKVIDADGNEVDGELSWFTTQIKGPPTTRRRKG